MLSGCGDATARTMVPEVRWDVTGRSAVAVLPGREGERALDRAEQGQCGRRLGEWRGRVLGEHAHHVGPAVLRRGQVVEGEHARLGTTLEPHHPPLAGWQANPGGVQLEDVRQRGQL